MTKSLTPVTMRVAQIVHRATTTLYSMRSRNDWQWTSRFSDKPFRNRLMARYVWFLRIPTSYAERPTDDR